MRHAKLFDEAVGIAALLTCALACASNDSPDALDAQQETWQAQEPERYVVQTCTLGIEPPGCIRAIVDSHGVTAAEERIFDPGVPGWEAIDLRGRPLDGMFDDLRARLHEGCTVDELQYDDDFGYIQTYRLTCEVEEGRFVACFEPDADDLDACDEEP